MGTWIGVEKKGRLPIYGKARGALLEARHGVKRAGLGCFGGKQFRIVIGLATCVSGYHQIIANVSQFVRAYSKRQYRLIVTNESPHSRRIYRAGT